MGEELLTETGSLCRHAFGHHVIHAVLEHGLPKHKGRIVECLMLELVRNAMNRYGSYVIEKALHHCSGDDCDGLAHALLTDAAAISILAQNKYGCYVVKALLSCPGQHPEVTMAQLRCSGPLWHSSKYGRRLLQDIGLHVVGIDACAG